MDIGAIRSFVETHPSGVRIRMADGKVYDIPHRDYVTFRPEKEVPSKNSDRRTSFYVWEGEGFRLVNSLLVVEVAERSNGSNGNGKHKKGSPKRA